MPLGHATQPKPIPQQSLAHGLPLSPTIDFLEHPVHVLHVAVVQEPDAGVMVVLLKGHCADRPQRHTSVCI